MHQDDAEHEQISRDKRNQKGNPKRKENEIERGEK